MVSKPHKPRSIEAVAGNLASLSTAANFHPASERRSSLPPIARAIESQNIDALERVKELEAEIKDMRADGRYVQPVDPSLVDPSRFRDRNERFALDDAFTDLWTSIRDEGQHVPALLRPKPEDPGRYETVFGHRRVQACRQLGIPVKAVVCSVTDAELAVAAYSENNRRQGLSVFEQAFALAKLLDRRVFPDQATMSNALQVSKQHVSNLLSLAEIPEEFLDALGDWRACSMRDGYRLRDVARDPSRRAGAVERAMRIASTGEPRGLRTRIAVICGEVSDGSGIPPTLTDADGRLLATLKAKGRTVAWAFDARIDPALLRYLWDRLPTLVEEYRKSRAHSE